MLGLKRDIFYDLDGSLTNTHFNAKTIDKGALVQGFPHLLQEPACAVAATPSKWDNAAVCD